MAIPNGSFPGVVSHLKILRKFKGVGGAGVFAEAAEHAARGVVSEGGEDFAPGGVVAFPPHNDKIFRAGQGAKIAADAESLTGFGMVVEAGRAPVTFRDHGPLERILFGVNVFGVLGAEGYTHAL